MSSPRRRSTTATDRIAQRPRARRMSSGRSAAGRKTCCVLLFLASYAPSVAFREVSVAVWLLQLLQDTVKIEALRLLSRRKVLERIDEFRGERLEPVRQIR